MSYAATNSVVATAVCALVGALYAAKRALDGPSGDPSISGVGDMMFEPRVLLMIKLRRNSRALAVAVGLFVCSCGGLSYAETKQGSGTGGGCPASSKTC
jgi:hypothetical protein